MVPSQTIPVFWCKKISDSPQWVSGNVSSSWFLLQRHPGGTAKATLEKKYHDGFGPRPPWGNNFQENDFHSPDRPKTAISGRGCVPCRLIFDLQCPHRNPSSEFSQSLKFCIGSGGFCTRFTKICTWSKRPHTNCFAGVCCQGVFVVYWYLFSNSCTVVRSLGLCLVWAY